MRCPAAFDQLFFGINLICTVDCDVKLWMQRQRGKRNTILLCTHCRLIRSRNSVNPETFCFYPLAKSFHCKKYG